MTAAKHTIAGNTNSRFLTTRKIAGPHRHCVGILANLIFHKSKNEPSEIRAHDLFGELKYFVKNSN